MMRNMYYVLEADLRVEGLATVMDLPEEINFLKLFQGKKMIEDKTPISLKLTRGSGDFRGDIFAGILPLFHEDLLDYLDEFGIENVQYFPVDLTDPHSGEIEYGYYLINIIGLISCVKDYDMSLPPLERPTHLAEFSIEPSRVNGAHIFRLAEQPQMIIINEELRSFLLKKEVVGVRMRQTENYSRF